MTAKSITIYAWHGRDGELELTWDPRFALVRARALGPAAGCIVRPRLLKTRLFDWAQAPLEPGVLYTIQLTPVGPRSPYHVEWVEPKRSFEVPGAPGLPPYCLGVCAQAARALGLPDHSQRYLMECTDAQR